VWIDAVNDPDRYNRALRCRCDVNDDFGEDSVLRRERTAVHCNEESWSESTLRIEMALLNGMYMNCENWCLFDIFEPNERYWEWNPWGECWEDTIEETLCDRVVSEYYDEVVYAQRRASSFCEPLIAPVGSIDFVWQVGILSTSCAETCLDMVGGKSECTARALVAVNNDADHDFVRHAFSEAGVTCNTISVGDKGFTGTPAHRGDHCITTGGSVESGFSYCNRLISNPYIRLCACTV